MIPTTASPIRIVSIALFALLPLAATAQAPALPSSTSTAAPEAKPALRSQQVRPGLHVLLGAGGNVVVWSGTDGIALVDDSIAGATPQLLEVIAKIAPGPVRFVVNTNWHPDHTGGNEALGRAGAVIIAHDNTRSRMREPQVVQEDDTKVPAAHKAALPVITFADSTNLHLNGDNLLLVHADEAQTDGDLVAWWESANVVQVGDLFYNGSYPFIDLGSGGSLAGVVAAIEIVLARADAKTVVIPGHGPVSNRAELAAYRDMLVAVGRRVRELVEQDRSEQEIVAARPTADFDERYGRGSMTPERFVRLVYADLVAGR
jgi:glyoxylase-like metal-dependent hydrolase (beta-lactamase superfamily II)